MNEVTCLTWPQDADCKPMTGIWTGRRGSLIVFAAFSVMKEFVDPLSNKARRMLPPEGAWTCTSEVASIPVRIELFEYR